MPALLCGVAAGAIRPARVSWRSYCWAGLLGGLYATAFQAGLASRDFTWSEFHVLLLLGGLPGLAGAVVCARILYGKSSKAAAEPDAPA